MGSKYIYGGITSPEDHIIVLAPRSWFPFRSSNSQMLQVFRYDFLMNIVHILNHTLESQIKEIVDFFADAFYGGKADQLLPRHPLRECSIV